MASNPTNTTADGDIANFSRSLPPPPYPGEGYDLTPTPQSVNRPRLPEERRNPWLARRASLPSFSNISSSPAVPEDATIVKFQTIVREGKEIIIGRIKVLTVRPIHNRWCPADIAPQNHGAQHAFILRRYDTNAVSLTTMFKVAFPGSTDDEEKREMDWVWKITE